MADIIRIMIKGSAGYGPIEEAYNDKVTISMDSIRYEYRPVIENDVNVNRKWSYKTTCPIFQKLYKDACAAVQEILGRDINSSDCDAGEVLFVVTYADKTKRERSFFLPGDDFKECFLIIKQMVPGCEYVPAVLLTSEDYADEV